MIQLARTIDATIIRPATPADLPDVDAMRSLDANCLGFFPLMKYECIVHKVPDHANRETWRRESLWVATDNGDITGFVLAGFHRDGTKIEQICVRRDARRMERALLLEGVVDTEAKRRQSARIKCRVAADIEANLFWVAAGYTPVAVQASTYRNLRPSQNKRALVIYHKTLAQGFFGFSTEAIQDGEWRSKATTSIEGASSVQRT